MSPGVCLQLILAHSFVRNTNMIRKVGSQRGIASHCEVKNSSEWDSKTFESSKIKELFSVSLKRPWGMGITHWFLSECRQSTGFKMFLVDRKGETSEKIKFMPIVSYPPTAHHIGESDSHLLDDLPVGTGVAVRCPQSHLCPRLDKAPAPGSPQGHCSSPDHHWARCSLAMSFPYWGDPNWPQCLDVVWWLLSTRG